MMTIPTPRHSTLLRLLALLAIGLPFVEDAAAERGVPPRFYGNWKSVNYNYYPDGTYLGKSVTIYRYRRFQHSGLVIRGGGGSMQFHANHKFFQRSPGTTYFSVYNHVPAIIIGTGHWSVHHGKINVRNVERFYPRRAGDFSPYTVTRRYHFQSHGGKLVLTSRSSQNFFSKSILTRRGGKDRIEEGSGSIFFGQAALAPGAKP